MYNGSGERAEGDRGDLRVAPGQRRVASLGATRQFAITSEHRQTGIIISAYVRRCVRIACVV